MSRWVDDLSNKFLEEYEPNAPFCLHYFLDIISKKETVTTVDGQQRPLSLTPFLLRKNAEKVNVDELLLGALRTASISSAHRQWMRSTKEALRTNRPVSAEPCSAPSKPRNLLHAALPYFIDWLLENVHFESPDDLRPTADFVAPRGRETHSRQHPLARPHPRTQRRGQRWIPTRHGSAGRHQDPRAGREARDFDRIGTEFHRWLRDAAAAVGLKQSEDFPIHRPRLRLL